MYNLKIDLQLPEGKEPKQGTTEELSTAMDPELHNFETWFRAKDNQPLVGMERTILKTYLAWKLLYEPSK